MSRITISSYFHLPGSRNSSWQRPFPRLTMPLLQRSHRQLPLRMFINLPPTMESFLVNGWFCPKELVMNSPHDGDDYRVLGHPDHSCRRNVFFRGSFGKWWRDSRGDR